MPYFHTLELGVDVSVTVNVFPFTPIGIVWVAVGAILLPAKFIVKAAVFEPVTTGPLETTLIK